MKIDGHIHFSEDLGSDRLRECLKEQKLDGAALLCIPKGGSRAVEEDAFRFKRTCDIPVWVFGGIDRRIYDITCKNEQAKALKAEPERLMGMGCTGIKMLEGKPDGSMMKHTLITSANTSRFFMSWRNIPDSAFYFHTFSLCHNSYPGYRLYLNGLKM